MIFRQISSDEIVTCATIVSINCRFLTRTRLFLSLPKLPDKDRSVKNQLCVVKCCVPSAPRRANSRTGPANFCGEAASHWSARVASVCVLRLLGRGWEDATCRNVCGIDGVTNCRIFGSSAIGIHWIAEYLTNYWMRSAGGDTKTGFAFLGKGCIMWEPA